MKINDGIMRQILKVSMRTIGFHDSGWKSDIDKHNRVFGCYNEGKVNKFGMTGKFTLNRPLGVFIWILGGLYGYSRGNVTIPW